MRKFLSGKLLLPSLILSLAACGGGDNGGEDNNNPTNPDNPLPPPNPATQGTLNVDIVNPGKLAGATVIVAGAGGVRSVMRDSALTLAAGDYAVSVLGVRDEKPIVDDVVGAVDKSSVTIVAGDTESVTADYTQVQPGSGRMWYPVRDNGGADGQIRGFDRETLQTGDIGAEVIGITGVGTEPINTIFDRGGNLWVASFNDNKLLKYNADQLAAGGSLTPDVVIGTDGDNSLNRPVGLAFDPKGNLWVGNFGPLSDTAANDTLVRLTPRQLAQNGQPTPVVRLTGFTRPYGHAFDEGGNLWVGNNGADNVLRYSPAQQKNGGVPDAPVTETTIGDLNGARGIAFDGDGKMWVSVANRSEAAAFEIDDDGTATPVITVTLKNGQKENVPSPDGLAFDNEGNLWAAASDNRLYRYSVNDLVDGQNVVPEATISGFGASRGILFSFYPPALDLPLAR